MQALWNAPETSPSHAWASLLLRGVIANAHFYFKFSFLKISVVTSIKIRCYCQFFNRKLYSLLPFPRLAFSTGRNAEHEHKYQTVTLCNKKLQVIYFYPVLLSALGGERKINLLNQLLSSMDLTLNFGLWGVLLQLVSTVTPPLRRRLQSSWNTAASTPASAALTGWLAGQFPCWQHTYRTRHCGAGFSHLSVDGRFTIAIPQGDCCAWISRKIQPLK